MPYTRVDFKDIMVEVTLEVKGERSLRFAAGDAQMNSILGLKNKLWIECHIRDAFGDREFVRGQQFRQEEL